MDVTALISYCCGELNLAFELQKEIRESVSLMSVWRCLIAVTLLGITGSAAAQLQLGDMTHLSLVGTVGTAYAGSYTNQAFSSTHSVNINGDGFLNGYYFSPNFLNINVHPYYGRTQDTTNSVSIGTSSGIGSIFNLFSGSSFPGSINYAKTENGTGQYAIPGSSSLVTNVNSNSFGVNWAENLFGLPHVSVGYNHTNSNSNIIGTQGNNVSNFTGFNVSSSYQLDGWPLNLNYTRSSSSSETPATLTGTASTDGGSGSTLQFFTNHNVKLLKGGFSAGYTRSDYTYNSQNLGPDSEVSGETGNNKSNSVTAGLNMGLLKNVSANTQFGYDDNLLGTITQQEISSGGGPLISNNGPLRNLLFSGSMGWNAPRGIVITGGAIRTQQYYEGVEYDSTAAFGNLNYFYNRPLLGSLLFTFGFNDAATKDGNEGMGFFGNANFTRKMYGFDVSAFFGYSQNMQTLATFVTSSGVNYGVGVSRKILRGTNWNANFGGGRSVFNGSPGESNSQRFSTGFSRRRISMSAFMGQSHSYALLTSAGLITPTVPSIFLAGNATTFDSSNYGISGNVELIRHLTLTGAYSKETGSSITTGSPEIMNKSTVEYMLLRYPYRKLYFQASYNRVQQGVLTSGNPLIPATSYSFGIYRWLKVF